MSIGCFNFSLAQDIASLNPIQNYSDQEIRTARTYLNYLEYVNDTSNCNLRNDFENPSKILLRNTVEDGIGYVSQHVQRFLDRCVCGDWGKENETAHECMVRFNPKVCDLDQVIYTSDDFPPLMPLFKEKISLDHINGRELAVARVIYAIAFVGALISCFIATLVYLKSPGLQTVANIFIINLILANSIITVLAIPIQILETLVHLPYPWIIPRPYWLASTSCRVYYFIRYLGFYATSYSLALIGYERYNAICKPLESQRQMSKKRALKMVAAVWLLSGILTIPTMFSHVSNLIV